MLFLILLSFLRWGRTCAHLAGADVFVSLVIGRQARLAMLGIATDPEQVDRRIRAAVDLFVRGMAVDA